MGHFPSDPAPPGWAAADVLCIGETVWDARLGEGDAPFAHLSLVPGGGAFNTALALTQRGLSVRLCGAVGDDVLGRLFAGVAAPMVGLEQAGLVQTGARGAGHTGLAQIDARGASPVFTSDRDVAWEARTILHGLAAVPEARAVVVSGLLPSVRFLHGVRRFLERAQARGALTMVDLNARPRLWAKASSAVRKAALDALAHTYCVKSAPADERSLGLAETELRAPCAAVWIRTLGPAPVEVRAFGSSFSCAVEPIDTRDASGAGDAFTAAIVATMAFASAAERAREETWKAAVLKGIESARSLLVARSRAGRGGEADVTSRRR